MAASLFDLKFIVLSGKGGVGRTVVAAALARAAAARGRRVLIAQTNAIERLGKMLGRTAPARGGSFADAASGTVVAAVDEGDGAGGSGGSGAIGATAVSIAPGIDAVNMTPKESLHQYALLVLRYEAVYRALFQNRAVRGFLSAIPGLDAYAMLGKAWWHTTELADGDDRRGGGPQAGAPSGRRHKYDLVILDGPASGHAVAMLKIPQAIISTASAGPLVKDARALRELLGDPRRSALVIVTRAEELPARETRELAGVARNELGIPLGAVIVNAVPPARLSEPPTATVLDRLAAGTGDVELDTTLRMAATVRAHRATAEQVMASLAADVCAPWGHPFVALPWLPSTDLGLREIDLLASALAQGLSTPAPLLPRPNLR
ncbi:MAG: ArsA-related P-loop ATPase [Pseudomonadota bacterium]